MWDAPQGKLLILPSCFSPGVLDLCVVTEVFSTDWTRWLMLFFGWKTVRNDWTSAVHGCELGDKTLVSRVHDRDNYFQTGFFAVLADNTQDYGSWWFVESVWVGFISETLTSPAVADSFRRHLHSSVKVIISGLQKNTFNHCWVMREYVRNRKS